MNDHIGIVHEFREQLPILDVVQVVLEARAGHEMANILNAARGKIVEQDNAVTAIQQPLREMRSNKTGTARDQKAQRALLKELANRRLDVGRRPRSSTPKPQPDEIPQFPADRSHTNTGNTGKSSSSPERWNRRR